MRFIQNGDVYTVRVGGLGELTNSFRILNSHEYPKVSNL